MEILDRENKGLLVGPDGRHKVDNEQIVGIQEEADTTNTLGRNGYWTAAGMSTQ